MDSLFEEADVAADAMRKRPGFSEADLKLMFRRLQKHWHPNYTDNQVRDLFEIWLDHHRANRAAEKRTAIDRITVSQKEREALVAQLPAMATTEQFNAGLRVMAIANEIAAIYARATGREGPPPPADAASWA
jgi:3'-phosphoadenosine 5'-phosphosulfate (PAPS) 3'-phosphatase